MKTQVAQEPLAELLDRHTVTGAAELCRAEGDRIRCLACGHRCLIGEGGRGICKVRFNQAGRLQVPFGYVAGVQCDPVEKKPFFHVYPGSDALTFGMMGCDLHCSYCQNWLTSQALRDRDAVTPIRPVAPAELIEIARRERAKLVVSSYNEPLITAEWAVAVFRAARDAGLNCAFVSNGNATPEVLDFLRPWLIAYKVDLKSFDDHHYRSLGCTLDTVQRTIRMIHERGLWLEVVTLVIPGFNDGADELRSAAHFLASVSSDIPWHVTAFHRDYKMTEPDPPSGDALVRAAEIGTQEGLRFVYAGNLPGRVGPWEDTRCPSCRVTLIKRFGYLVRDYRITPDGFCPSCRTRVPGIWPSSAAEVRTGNDHAAYQQRLPRPMAVGAPEMVRLESRSLPMTAQPSPSEKRESRMPPSEVVSPARSSEVPLSFEQRRQLAAAARAMMRTVVDGGIATLAADCAALGDRLVPGIFVSLKRGRHLRSCCGRFGQVVPLRQALSEAVVRTAREDARFPPVSPSELPYLDLEVWLLHEPQPVHESEDRLRAVDVDRHGVQIVRGNAHALFLPAVARENGWDARRLLDQLCIKAGLYPTAWKEDAARLSTFEGEVCRDARVPPKSVTAMERPVAFGADVLPVLLDFCRRELGNLLRGTTPGYYCSGIADSTVTGLVLSLERTGQGRSLYFSQLALRSGLPLQATLFTLVQTAAQQLAAQRSLPTAQDPVTVGLTLLHDPAMHGTVTDPLLESIDPRQRALLVLDGNRSGLVFDPDRLPAELLKDAAGRAQVAQPPAAGVFSLGVVSSVASLHVASVPKPIRGHAVRAPAAAGNFYPAEADELARTLDRLLTGERRPQPWAAALLPHAGLRFSGAVAAAVLQQLELPRTVLVIGPKHTPIGMDWAVAPHQTWSIPGIEVESDWTLARRLSETIPGLAMDAAAHQREHAIEVELPLLARLAPQSRIVGVVIGRADLEQCRRFAAGLAEVVRGCRERPLLLISSDMNHFAPDEATRELDALALEALERCDPAGLFEITTQRNISMCGMLPAVIVLETLKLLGLGRDARRVAYATSADVTGDTSRVVGYAGMLFN